MKYAVGDFTVLSEMCSRQNVLFPVLYWNSGGLQLLSRARVSSVVTLWTEILLHKCRYSFGGWWWL